MKKIIMFLLCLIATVGCSITNEKASDAVEKYLNDYKSLSDNVLSDIDEIVEKENLETVQENSYKDVLKRQYRDLLYTIENESYDGDTADVTVRITVYDLYQAEKTASKYLNDNQDRFLTNGIYDSTKYLDYKLNEMKNITDTISYNIVFKTIKVDGKWQVEQPGEIVLQKIHGIYNYEED